MNSKCNQHALWRAPRGFSLIELLVVMAILVLLTSVILMSNARFGGAVLLESLAYDIALSVRQAQAYAVATRQSTATFNAGYGLHFDVGSNTYYFFADTDPPPPSGDGIFNSSHDTIVQTMNLERGFIVEQLCTTKSGSDEDCSAAKIDVLFRRPEPNAWIARNGTSCIASPFDCMRSARISVSSPRGDRSSIIVDNNGQVSVKKQ